MKVKKHITLLATCLIFAGASYGESIQGETPPVKGEVTVKSQSVEALSLASQLAAYGQENQMPEALVTAALIIHRTPTQEGVAKENATDAAPDKDRNSLPLNAEALVAAAAEMPGGESLAEVASEAISERAKGDVTGPNAIEEHVLANSSDTYRIRFRGNETAVVAIDGDGDTDLDLYIYDEYGNSVVSSISASDNEAVSFTPAQVGYYSIEVKNRGSVSNIYSLWTN